MQLPKRPPLLVSGLEAWNAWPGDCRAIRTEAKIRGFENRFQLVCRRIAVAMGQTGAEIWAEKSDLQPVHGESDSLLGDLQETANRQNHSETEAARVCRRLPAE